MREPKTGVIHQAIVDEADLTALSRKAWRLKKGYAVCRFSVWRDGRNVKREVPMHRLILGLPTGDPREGDHRNRNRLDNRRANLRVVTRGQNAQNLGPRRRWAKHGKDSGHRGVMWVEQGRKWLAVVRLNWRNHYLGRFVDPDEAARVSAAFRAVHMPFSAEGGAA